MARPFVVVVELRTRAAIVAGTTTRVETMRRSVESRSAVLTAAREASGVNAGGVRQQARALPEMPLALRSLDLWAETDKRLDARLEYDRCGDLRIVETEADAEKVRAIEARERNAGLTLEWVEGQALRSLVPTLSPRVLGGTFCPVGGELTALPLRVVDMVSKELNVHGIRGATRNDQRVVAELVERGRLRIPIHAALPLRKAAEAHAMLENDTDVVGRIVLHPWDD